MYVTFDTLDQRITRAHAYISRKYILHGAMHVLICKSEVIIE